MDNLAEAQSTHLCTHLCPTQGPAKHLQQHAYEYRRKLDTELASIRRLKELQVRRGVRSDDARRLPKQTAPLCTDASSLALVATVCLSAPLYTMACT